MSLELFLTLLTTSTPITILMTESVKRLLVATSTPRRDNIVAWFCAMVSSTGVGVAYRIPFGLGFCIDQVVRLWFLIFFTWVLSMVVYDKVIQTVGQHKRYVEAKRIQEEHHTTHSPH